MIRLVLHNFAEFSQVLVYVLNPFTLLLHDILSGTRISYLPFVDELANISDLSSYWGDAKLSKGPIVLVTTDCDAHGFFGSSRELTLRELGILHDLSEDREDSWSSLINVILLPPIEGVDESITIWVSINNKVELFFVLGQKLLESLSFRFRKSFGTWIVEETRVNNLG